jgi:hypothetical protein
MAPEVVETDDPGVVLADAGPFLTTRPVEHNLILTLLGERHRAGGHPSGRYWMARQGGAVVGVGLQSPSTFAATLTPMPPDAARSMAHAAMTGTVVALPGVSGEAGTAAAFAGHYGEVAGVGAVPVAGQRLYVAGVVRPPDPAPPGFLRTAEHGDQAMVRAWTEAFSRDIGEAGPPTAVTDQRVAEGRVVLWEDGGRVRSMAAHSSPEAGVARIYGVYTPDGQRRGGLAAATVAALTTRLADQGWGAVLYTDLGNPTSNGVYRRIGYRAVSEVVRYRFDPGDCGAPSLGDP